MANEPTESKGAPKEKDPRPTGPDTPLQPPLQSAVPWWLPGLVTQLARAVLSIIRNPTFISWVKGLFPDNPGNTPEEKKEVEK